jgi:Protein of unknown function (DUF3014)
MDKPFTPGPGAPRAPAHEPRYDPDGGISRVAMAAAAVLIALAIGGGWYWWQQRQPAVPPTAPTAVTEPAPVAAVPAPPPPAASEPAIQHPIEEPLAPATAAAPRTLDQAEGAVVQALSALLGSKPGASMVRRDDFVRRAVATIDNLGRAHAAPRLWPVNPMAGKFSIEPANGKEVISQANSVRYSAFIAFAESLDSARAATLYKQNYALFQTAYKELGYPRGYFNDRMVAVIDQLLATPEPAGPLAVKLTEVKGEVASTQPWTRYEFADPQLEALPAGSKALLRMGPENSRKLKAKLREFRAAIASGPAKN